MQFAVLDSRMSSMRLLAACLSLIGLVSLVGCTDDTPSSSPNTDAGDADASVQDASSEDADTGSDTAAADADAEDSTDSGDASDADAAPDASLHTVLGPDDRPAELLLPDDYDASQSYPLVIALHGYGMTGEGVDTYLELSELRHDRQFLFVAPDGNRDSSGQRFWNATDYCCDHYDANPNDAQYLIDLVDEASERFSVDADKVYFVGFSNGGFMAHRMACDYPSKIAGIASLSGSSYDDEDACGATDGGPRILHIHGTGDTVVGYYGTLAYPGARTVVSRWVERNGCNSDATDVGRADYDLNVVGDETWLREWEGCDGDSRVGFWSLQGGLHFPTLRDDFTPSVLDFLVQ